MKTKISLFFLAIVSLCWIQDNIVSNKDFRVVCGDWKGKLTYLDYTSGKPFTMPANVNISISKTDTNMIVLSYEYPNEPKANGKDTLFINQNGNSIDGAIVVSKIRTSDGKLQITTERDGTDGNDNKHATIKHIYTLGNKEYKSRKEVKFYDSKQWIQRNEFEFDR